ncbi:MAG: hypothetical protein AAF135_14330 [Bacteroidota bacterium]
MNELLLKLQEANRAVNQLMQMLEKAKEEKEILSRKVVELEQSIDDKQHAYDELIERYEAIKLVKVIENPEVKASVQEKIDWYLKEIDTCLKNFGD